MLPFIHLFDMIIPTYNLVLGIGAVCGILFFYRYSKNKLDPQIADNLLICAVISTLFGFVFGMLFDKLAHFTTPQDFASKLFTYTGITYLGGFVGASLVFLLIYKLMFHNYKSFALHTDFLMPSVVLAQTIGRIGCLLGGCCFGKPAKIFGISYSPNSVAYSLHGDTKLIPVPLIESLILFVIFALFIIYIKKNKLMYYCLFYGVSRFFLEYIRGDDRGNTFLNIFSPSQVICIILIGISVAFFARTLFKSKTYVTKNSDASLRSAP